jgi:hypothetical protein
MKALKRPKSKTASSGSRNRMYIGNASPPISGPNPPIKDIKLPISGPNFPISSTVPKQATPTKSSPKQATPTKSSPVSQKTPTTTKVKKKRA